MKSNRVKVFAFTTSDDDNPDFYASLEINKWLDTEQGKWLLEHTSPELEWESSFVVETYVTRYIVFAYLTPELQTFWKLKYQ